MALTSFGLTSVAGLRGQQRGAGSDQRCIKSYVTANKRSALANFMRRGYFDDTSARVSSVTFMASAMSSSRLRRTATTCLEIEKISQRACSVDLVT